MLSYSAKPETQSWGLQPQDSMLLDQSHILWFSQAFTQRLQKGLFCTISPTATFSQLWGTVTQATSAGRGTLTTLTHLTVALKPPENKTALPQLSAPALQRACCCALPSCTSQTRWHAAGSLPVSLSSSLLTGTRQQQKPSGKPNGAEPAPASRQPTAAPTSLEIFGFLFENSPFARLHLMLQGGAGCWLREITQPDLLCKHHCPVTFTHLKTAFNSATPAFSLN